MFKATNEIYEAITAHGLKASIRDEGRCSIVQVRFSLPYSAPIEVLFMNTDDDNDTAVRLELMHIKEEKVEMLLPVLNTLNNKYRYVKFTLNKDNDVFVEYDMPMAGCNIGECAKEMVARFIQIVNEAHPVLLQAVFVPQPSAMLS